MLQIFQMFVICLCHNPFQSHFLNHMISLGLNLQLAASPSPEKQRLIFLTYAEKPRVSLELAPKNLTVGGSNAFWSFQWEYGLPAVLKTKFSSVWLDLQLCDGADVSFLGKKMVLLTPDRFPVCNKMKEDLKFSHNQGCQSALLMECLQLPHLLQNGRTESPNEEVG